MRSSGTAPHVLSLKSAEMRDLIDKVEISGASNRTQWYPPGDDLDWKPLQARPRLLVFGSIVDCPSRVPTRQAFRVHLSGPVRVPGTFGRVHEVMSMGAVTLFRHVEFFNIPFSVRDQNTPRKLCFFSNTCMVVIATYAPPGVAQDSFTPLFHRPVLNGA
jgi:hypothetical protein